MKTCVRISEAVAWATQGNAHAVPDSLRDHALRCESCAEFVASVSLTRELGQSLPATAMVRARHDALKLELLSQARRHAGNSAHIRHLRLWLRLLVAAFITSGAAAAAKYATDRRTSLLDRARAPQALAQPLPKLETPSIDNSVANRLVKATSALLPRSEDSGKLPLPPGVDASEAAQHCATTTADDVFAQAWAALRDKRPTEASKRFDALLASKTLDPARRADVLYWSAQSHRQAGEAGAAISHSLQLLHQFPSAHHASDAALILGEYALARDQLDRAAQYLTQAAQSERSVVRERAQRGLRQLVKRQAH
jgi:hypothetical protein